MSQLREVLKRPNSKYRIMSFSNLVAVARALLAFSHIETQLKTKQFFQGILTQYYYLIFFYPSS